jgi:DNA-binding beta-propeller fold protein YncE
MKFRIPACCCLVGLIVASGCATKPKSRGPAVFYPPAPDEPRFQYLTSIGSSLDIEKQNKLMYFLTGTREEPKTFSKPYGLAVFEGRIFVCDSGGGVVIIDLVKHRFDFWMPEGRGQLRSPINIALDQDGNRFVADVGRGQVVIFDAQGNLIGEIGDEKTLKPTGVAVAGGRLYVTNLLKKRVEVYDASTREFLFPIPRDGAEPEAVMYAPTNIALDEKMNLYVSDTAGFHFKIYDADGKLLRKFGEVGTAHGQFIRPKGIAVDREHRVYSVDAATEVVQLFDDQDRLLMFLGKRLGTAPGLVLPAGICIDYDHLAHFAPYVDPGFTLEYLVLVVSQMGSSQINIYGFGHKK